LIGLDADPIELPRTEARLRAAGFGPEVFTAVRSNFAGLPQALASFHTLASAGGVMSCRSQSNQSTHPALSPLGRGEGEEICGSVRGADCIFG